MHLLEVFHPDLKTQNERADYIDKLRKVYHTMKVIELIVQVYNYTVLARHGASTWVLVLKHA